MDFKNKVYKIVGTIPKGKVATYKQIAHKIGTKSYRAVGQALKCNPCSPKIPCHRVVKSNGEIGGFFGKIDGDEIKRKISLLENEGIKIIEGKIENFEKVKI